MRRVFSVLFFVLGGWLLMVEPVIAFLDLGPEARSAQPWVFLITLGMAAVPLAIATVLSPGERWRELGLTILLSAGAALFAGISSAAVFLDPGSGPLIEEAVPNMPDFAFTPVTGILNLVVIAAIGWLLYRRPRNRSPR